MTLLHRIGHGIEHQFERLIFLTRWFLAPAYVVLCACILVLVWKTFEELVELILNLHTFLHNKAITQVLIIVDLILVINLILMVLFVGYNTFVSQLKTKEIRAEDAPKWMDDLSYPGLKIQVMGSVIAVSTINILRVMVDITDNGPIDKLRFTWIVTFHGVFLFSALIIAIVNYLNPHPSRKGESPQLASTPPD